MYLLTAVSLHPGRTDQHTLEHSCYSTCQARKAAGHGHCCCQRYIACLWWQAADTGCTLSPRMQRAINSTMTMNHNTHPPAANPPTKAGNCTRLRQMKERERELNTGVLAGTGLLRAQTGHQPTHTPPNTPGNLHPLGNA
jgi:hypothetical protein